MCWQAEANSRACGVTKVRGTLETARPARISNMDAGYKVVYSRRHGWWQVEDEQGHFVAGGYADEAYARQELPEVEFTDRAWRTSYDQANAIEAEGVRPVGERTG